jgi:hypothetical protein
MKKLLLLIVTFFIFTISGFCQADTISYWHAYLDGKIVFTCTGISEDPILNLHYEDIKKDSKLTTKYFRDTPCHNCSTHLIISNIHGKVIMKIKGTGTLDNLHIPIYKLIKNQDISLESRFKVNYREGNYVDQLLFTIIMN